MRLVGNADLRRDGDLRRRDILHVKGGKSNRRRAKTFGDGAIDIFFLRCQFGDGTKGLK